MTKILNLLLGDSKLEFGACLGFGILNLGPILYGFCGLWMRDARERRKIQGQVKDYRQH